MYRKEKNLFNAKEFIESSLKEIRAIAKDAKVISACSGGVDSTVTTALVHKALGDNALAVFIDDGLRREGEPEFVLRTLKNLGVKTRYVDAKKEFFTAFKGKIDAEEKRKAFRNTFYTIFGKVAKEENTGFIVQGTIKADVIETVKGSDFCLLVTEPTPFGLNDLELAVGMLEKLGIPMGVVINKADIGDRKVWDYCQSKQIPVLMEIPMDRKIAESYSKGIPIVADNSSYIQKFQELFKKVERVYESPRRRTRNK